MKIYFEKCKNTLTFGADSYYAFYNCCGIIYTIARENGPVDKIKNWVKERFPAIIFEGTRCNCKFADRADEAFFLLLVANGIEI